MSFLQHCLTLSRSRLTEAALLQWLYSVRARSQLQLRFCRHAAESSEGGAVAAGHLQHVPAAVCAVSAEHGLHPGAGPAAVARSQVCVPQKNSFSNARVMGKRSDLEVEHTWTSPKIIEYRRHVTRMVLNGGKCLCLIWLLNRRMPLLLNERANR